MIRVGNLAASALTALAVLSGAGSANAIVVGGIDFGATGLIAHIETATIAASFVSSAGQVAQSYGLISTVNGNSTYCADGSANCALYFVTSSTVSATSGANIYEAGTKMTIFFSNSAAVNLLGQDSAANLGFITGLTKWATLKGENGVDPSAAGLASDKKLTQALAGASITASGGGLLSADEADGLGIASVEAFINVNSIPTFTGAFADVTYIEASNNLVLNPLDLAGAGGDSCFTGAPQVGDWCLGGAADFRGLTAPPKDPPTDVPVPGTVTLLAIALLGIRAVPRSRRV